MRTNYASVHDSFPPLPAAEMSVFVESLKPETHVTNNPPQSVGSIDPRFLHRSRNCLCQEIKAALCFVLEDRSPAQTVPYRVRINCERINAPFGDDDSLFARAFAFTPNASRAPASSSRGRDCGRNQLAGNAGLFRLTRFVRRL